MSTLSVTNLKNAASATNNLVLNPDGSVNISGGTLSPQTGFKNRIINGGMTIDQRNAGASVAFSTATQFPIDRWNGYSDQANSTGQRSAIAPAGFINSVVITVGTGSTPSAGQVSRFEQRIEGLNVFDLGFGTAAAQPVTVSFWVRSSVTGTHSGVLSNVSGNRSYPFTFAINSANTWEYETVTIPGDTSGTWTTDNSTGMKLMFNFGTGSTYLGTAGAWAGATLFGATGSVQLTATSGATFYITGTQLERGSVATPFEFRSIGQELSLCERYFQTITNGMRVSAMAFSSSALPANWIFKTTMRAAPTTTATVGSSTILSGGANLAVTSIGGGVSTVYNYSMDVGVASGATTAGFGAELRLNAGRIDASAEL